MSVHATFTEFGDAGKRWRMLESGLWAVVEPAYFEQGNYLTFDIPAAPSDPAPCVGTSCVERSRRRPPLVESALACHCWLAHHTSCSSNTPWRRRSLRRRPKTWARSTARR
eukprot:scaffold243552_cov32-Tisochrysis_lutea.AAC.3